MSAPTPDYGEPWALDSSDGFWNKVVDAAGKTVAGVVPTRRAITCVNTLAGVQDPAAHLANLNATIERWETELSAAMPPDFKDWFQNDKSEWPLVARRAIESLREREDFAMKAIEQQAETLKVMNDALKEAHRIFGNMSHSQVVQRLCPDFAEVAELVRKSHDQHA